jgi:hypothetical protein
MFDIRSTDGAKTQERKTRHKIIVTYTPISGQRPKHTQATIEKVLQEVFLCGPRHAHC